MKIIFNKYIAFILLMTALTTGVQAQTLHSLYFLDGNNMRNDLNPAFTNRSGYIAFPALGNMYISSNSNIGLGAIMTPRGNNEMITFMNSDISADDALSKFKKTNIVETDIKIDLLRVGFNAWGGSNSIGVSVRSQIGLYLPKDIFTFMKLGQTGSPTSYNISNINAETQNYAEIALGHARNINKKIAVGAKVKVLLGGAYASAQADYLNIYMSDEKWMINEHSKFVGSKGINFTNDTEKDEISDIDFDNFGVAGMGLGLDLGVVYKLQPDLTLSFAITDLGFINWKDCVKASNKNQEFEYHGFDNIGVEDDQDGNNAFDDAADDVWDSLKGMAKFHDDGKTSKTKSLYTTFRAGAEYGILTNKITFGFLGSMRVGAPRVWTEGMLSANFKPVKWFNAAVNGSVSNTRSSLGAVVNFCPKAVNFFIGGDYLLAKFSKQFVPVNAAKFNIGFGLSFNI